MAVAGRILIMPKGDYSASVTYEMLDIVNYNGFPWLAKKTVVGITPSRETSEYWHPLLGISIANDLTTEIEGMVLDARMGKVLFDEILKRQKTVTVEETLTFENGIASFGYDLSEYGMCSNVIATAIGVGHIFNVIITETSQNNFGIQVMDATEPTFNGEVVFKITYLYE